MRCHPIVLLLWVTTASVRGETGEIKVKSELNGVLLKCEDTWVFKEFNTNEVTLEYKDENSGEYECHDESLPAKSSKIYVKFRTCDNCIELDAVSLIGMVVGNLVATVAIGVAVYLTASHGRTNLSGTHKKSSDRQHLVPNEVKNRAPNDHYQPLNHKGAQRDMYDVLTSRR